MVGPNRSLFVTSKLKISLNCRIEKEKGDSETQGKQTKFRTRHSLLDSTSVPYELCRIDKVHDHS